MQEVLIRKATNRDIERVADIKVEGWQKAFRGIVDDDFLDKMDAKDEAKNIKNSKDKGAEILVAEIEKQVVGFCLFRNYNKHKDIHPQADCGISSLYVASKLKGHGIGRKLMQSVFEVLKKEGKSCLILGCLKENYPTRAFYDKMGGKILSFDETKFGNKTYELVTYQFNLASI